MDKDFCLSACPSVIASVLPCGDKKLTLFTVNLTTDARHRGTRRHGNEYDIPRLTVRSLIIPGYYLKCTMPLKTIMAARSRFQDSQAGGNKQHVPFLAPRFPNKLFFDRLIK